MICKVKETIEKHLMLKDVNSVAVGLSGGADSMCLIDILTKLKSEYNIEVKAVHVNHNIRGDEAERDALFVKEYCDKAGVELLLYSVDIPALSKEYGISEEECGRKIRYECFSNAQCDAVATAHTLSDSVETVVFNLIRGTGTKGLSGIPAKRKPNIIRPLIDCTRSEIEDYCKNNNLRFVTDSTNLEDEYKRNFIRHNIIPSLNEVNSSAVRSIAKSAEIIKEESNFIDECAERLLYESKRDDGFSIKAFLSVHTAVRKRALRILLAEKMRKSVEQRHVNLCEEAIINEKGKVELSKDLYICVDSDIIHFCCDNISAESWETEVKEDYFSTPYGIYKLVPATDKDGIDADKIRGALFASSKKDGDRIYIKRRKVTKSLKKAFNEMKIPSLKRNEYAVLRDSESIVWVEGIGTDGKYLPDDKSKNVFKIIKDVENHA